MQDKKMKRGISYVFLFALTFIPTTYGENAAAYTCQATASDAFSTFVAPKNFQSFCEFRIDIRRSGVCRLRLDFTLFTIAPPRNLTNDPFEPVGCHDDKMLIIHPQETNLGVQEFCGTNSGQHVYLNVLPPTVVTLVFHLTSERASRPGRPSLIAPRWDIKVTEVNCSEPSTGTNAIPSDGCLQYFTSTKGTFQSFSYSNGLQLPNLNYAVCFKRRLDACGIKFSSSRFQMSAVDFLASFGNNGCDHYITRPDGQTYFSHDYVFIPNGQIQPYSEDKTDSKFCGSFLQGKSITSRMNGPFIFYVHTDDQRSPFTGNEYGFQIQYEQLTGC